MGVSAYISFAALRATRGAPAAWVAIVALPLFLLVSWRLTSPPTKGEDRVSAATRNATRACAAGAAAYAAATTGLPHLEFLAASNGAAAWSSTAALVAIARMDALGGILKTPRSARRIDAAIFSLLFWTVAIVLPLLRFAAPDETSSLDAILLDYATIAASLGAHGVAIAALLRTQALRRFELGVRDRIASSVLLAIGALAAGASLSAFTPLTAERVLPTTLMAAEIGRASCRERV